MRYLILLLAHVVLYKIFRFDFLSIFLFIVLIVDDLFTIRQIYKYFANKKYKLYVEKKVKILALMLNIAAVCLSCNLIYVEYLSPASKEVSKQFNECSFYDKELKQYERFMDLVPSTVKYPVVIMSEITDIMRYYNEASENATEEEESALQAELQVKSESLRSEAEDIMKSVERRQYSQIIIVLLLLISTIVYAWEDIVDFIKRIFNIFRKAIKNQLN